MTTLEHDFELADDPAVIDGLCMACAKEKSGPFADLDPFCSSACCRAWHGCQLPDARNLPLTKKGETATVSPMPEQQKCS